MDQDYHYYGTYTAAKMTGWDDPSAAIIARAANYVDFFSEGRFRGYWNIQKHGNLVRTVNYPRYTFQANYTGNAAGAEGLWSAFHFLPGNYKVPKQNVKTLPDDLVQYMTEGEFKLRDKTSGDDAGNLWRLTRPLSDLSRAIVTDMHLLAMDLQEIRRILVHGPGLEYLIDKGKDEFIEDRFLKILIGVRAHVIADTWAHQDFAGVRSVNNTYYDVNQTRVPGKYGILYKTPSQHEYAYRILGRVGQNYPVEKMSSDAFFAAPALGKAAQNGHGWMSHLPDYSFISYKYRPCWMRNYEVHERNNPAVYLDAFYDLLYYLHLANKRTGPIPPLKKEKKDCITKSINAEWGGNDTIPRVFSAKAWRQCIDSLNYAQPPFLDTEDEKGKKAALDGEDKNYLQYSSTLGTAYGTFTIEILKPSLASNNETRPSDFYLFQLAADYHFNYVKSWLNLVRNHKLSDSWSIQPGPLGGAIQEITDRRVHMLSQGGGPVPVRPPRPFPPLPNKPPPAPPKTMI